MSRQSYRKDRAQEAFLSVILEYMLSGILGLATMAAFGLLCLVGLLSLFGVLPKVAFGLMAVIFMALVFWMYVAE